MNGSRSIAMTALLLLAAHSSALAQVANGNIRGTVLDPSEAVIPGAAITLTNTSTLTNDGSLANSRTITTAVDLTGRMIARKVDGHIPCKISFHREDPHWSGLGMKSANPAVAR